MRAPMLALLLAVALPGVGRAQFPGGAIRIGVLNDMSGIFADLSGKGSVAAAQMAADDFAKEAGPDAPRVEISGRTTRTRPTSVQRSPGAGSTRTAWPRWWTCRTRPWRSPSTR